MLNYNATETAILKIRGQRIEKVGVQARQVKIFLYNIAPMATEILVFQEIDTVI